MRTKRNHKKRFKYRLGYSLLIRRVKQPITLEEATKILAYAMGLDKLNAGIIKCILQ